MAGRMLRILGGFAVVVVAAAVPAAAQTNGGSASTFQIPASTYSPPRTPWGDPDIQGVWDNHNVIPMQRPANLAGKKTFTDEELARFAASRAGNGTDAVCLQNDERCARATVAEMDRIKAYNGFWTPLDFVTDNRTALIEDPEDGRIPPLTPQARAKQEAHIKAHPPVDENATDDVPVDHWDDFDTRTRCIAIQVPSGVMAYNSASYIMQSPGWVMIALERLNTRMIALDGRPHSSIRTWQGDSRGHWEGNTLVVETINFLDTPTNDGGGSVVPGGVSEGHVRLIEHFVPMGPNRIHYYATVEDASTWTRPWTFMQPWEKDRVLSYNDSLGTVGGKAEPYQMYEYACHEGNRSIETALKRSWQDRQRPASQAARSTAGLSPSLVGKTQDEIRAMFGAPVEIAGPRWNYETADGILQFFVFFENGKVVRVRPDDLPLDQVVRTR